MKPKINHDNLKQSVKKIETKTNFRVSCRRQNASKKISDRLKIASSFFASFRYMTFYESLPTNNQNYPLLLLFSFFLSICYYFVELNYSLILSMVQNKFYVIPLSINSRFIPVTPSTFIISSIFFYISISSFYFL